MKLESSYHIISEFYDAFGTKALSWTKNNPCWWQTQYVFQNSHTLKENDLFYLFFNRIVSSYITV